MTVSSLGIAGLVFLFSYLVVGSFGIPGGTVTIVVFGSLANSFPSLLLVILISFLACVFGDILAYELARKLSGSFLIKLRKFSFFSHGEEKAREVLQKNEFSFVFFTRFALISLCPVISYVAGFQKLNRKKYFSAVVAGEFLFAAIYSILGYLIGETVSSLVNAVNEIVLVVLLIILGYYLIRFIISRVK